jgi:hypothetical protein
MAEVYITTFVSHVDIRYSCRHGICRWQTDSNDCVNKYKEITL